MARGFESKDVEYQQAEAASHVVSRPPIGAAERDARDRRRSLELSLSRMRADLSVATRLAHRQTLEAAIESLEAALSSLPA
jgi:hypothetical protein